MDVRSYFSVRFIFWRSGEQTDEPASASTSTTAVAQNITIIEQHASHTGNEQSSIEYEERKESESKNESDREGEREIGRQTEREWEKEREIKIWFLIETYRQTERQTVSVCKREGGEKEKKSEGEWEKD